MVSVLDQSSLDSSCFVSQGDRGDPGPLGQSGPKGDGYPGPSVR